MLENHNYSIGTGTEPPASSKHTAKASDAVSLMDNFKRERIFSAERRNLERYKQDLRLAQGEITELINTLKEWEKQLKNERSNSLNAKEKANLLETENEGFRRKFSKQEAYIKTIEAELNTLKGKYTRIVAERETETSSLRNQLHTYEEEIRRLKSIVLLDGLLLLGWVAR